MRAIRVGIVLMLATGSAAAANQPDPPQDLRGLTIEQLMQIDVTLGTRQLEPVRTTAAAIHVITAEDIRRSGVTTIADAIALADGLHVARTNNSSWAVSSRGFSTSGNKLLVMIDGRTEYSPLFSGTFWNMVDYVLEDIERIEVIRGPGATLWGANAVNGVINIITRHSRETRGTYVALGSGNEDPALIDARYGSAAAGATYRVYGKFAARAEQMLAGGAPANDARRRGQLGFRADGGRPDGSTWLLKGDAFHSRDDLPDRSDGEFTELALQGRWGRTLAPQSRLDIQSYYRREYRRIPRQLTHSIDTIDLDVQHAFGWRSGQRIVWGARHRVNHDETEPGTVAFEPRDRRYSLSGVFAQDEIAVRPDRLYVTVGLKAERNAFTGLEWQPTVRGRVQMGPRRMAWAALSRAVRRPTRLDVDVLAVGPAGQVIAIGGGESYRAETLVAAEAGYRAQPRSAVAFDATLFTHAYDDLRSQELPATGPPIVVGNTLDGRASGVELSTTFEPLPRWRTHVSYTYLDLTITREAASRDVGGGASETNDPRHRFALRTSLDLPRNVELGAHLRRVGELPNPAVPAYAELNVHVAWRPVPRVELSVTGQDLLHDRHPEAGAPAPNRHHVERSVRVGIAFRH